MEVTSSSIAAETPLSELKRITALMLELSDHFASIQRASNDLHHFFVQISGFDTKKPENLNSIALSNGKALGPIWAAFCIKDALRTKTFLRGVYFGIKAMLEKHPNSPVHILYAGTGPFAPLALPLTTVFRPEEVQFTFLEINPESIQYLKKVIEVLEVGAYVKAVVPGDASSYTTDPSQPVQIILVETMQPALQQEPQVAITLNLAPQIAAGGIFIPQSIRINAGLLNPKKDTERMISLDKQVEDHYILLDPVFELTALDLGQPHKFPPQKNQDCPHQESIVNIPPDIPVGYKQLCLFTSITVFESERLEYWQCHLTQPYKILTLDQETNPVRQVSFRYLQDERPGFESKVLEPKGRNSMLNAPAAAL